MKNLLLKNILFLISLVLFCECTVAQNDYSFNNDRSIKIENPIRGAAKFTIYIKAQSTSASQADGWGTYARLLGASGFFWSWRTTRVC